MIDFNSMIELELYTYYERCFSAVHSLTLHDTGGDEREQLRLAVSRAIQAACLRAGPRLLEPLYEAEVVCASEDQVPAVYTVLSLRNGHFRSERQDPFSPRYTIHGVLPVRAAFGLQAAMAAQTSRKAAVQASFNGEWQAIAPTALSQSVCAAYRQRAGLPAHVPVMADLVHEGAHIIGGGGGGGGSGASASGSSNSAASRKHAWDVATDNTAAYVTDDDANAAAAAETNSGIGSDTTAAVMDTAEPEPEPVPSSNHRPARHFARGGSGRIRNGDGDGKGEGGGGKGGCGEISKTKYNAKPASRNVHREPEAQALIQRAQELELQGQAMEAMALWRRAYRMCPQLEEVPYLSQDGGRSWTRGGDS